MKIGEINQWTQLTAFLAQLCCRTLARCEGKFTDADLRTIMIKNPVQSSYPPSRVFKIIQKDYGSEKAEQYLRRAREALFALNENIAESSVMTKNVNQLGLDRERIITEAESQLGQDLLTEDFLLAAKLGVRGFPTILMVNKESIAAKIVGTRSLDTYVSGLSRILKEKVQAAPRPLLATLLEKEHLLFAKEIEVMYDAEQTNFQGFVGSQLPAGSYEQHELLGETNFIKRAVFVKIVDKIIKSILTIVAISNVELSLKALFPLMKPLWDKN